MAHVFGPSRTPSFNDSEEGEGRRQNANLPPHNPLNFAERAVRLVVKETCYKMAQNIASGSRNRGQLEGNRWTDGVDEMSRQEREPRGPSHRQITFNAPDKDGTGRVLAIVNDSEEATR